MDLQTKKTLWRLKQISGCQRLGRGENGEGLLNAYVISFSGDENLLELDSGDGCTTL